MQDLFRFRHELSRLLTYAAAGFLMFTAGLVAAAPPQRQKIPEDFVQVIRSFLPEEILFLHTDLPQLGLLELEDGGLLGLSSEGRSVSRDGGKTWPRFEPALVDGTPQKGAIRHLMRLKSGAIGGFYRPGGETVRYGYSPWFVLSQDEGRTWSKPVRVAEPFNNAVLHGKAIVTSRGRIVAPVYTLVGRSIREKGKALFRDGTALVGHHGFDEFFTYCWVYYSDDAGRTWQPNRDKGVWAKGGELFVTLDQGAGGNYRCNEPWVVEVSPDHLLMLLRTPLGRLYQSWSQDDGTTWTRPEPTALASALAPPALEKLPGSNDLLVIWNQSSADEIERSLQRHRISSAVSRDGGASWRHGPNVFSIFRQQGDRNRFEPPPIRAYRSLKQAPRLPPNEMEGTYPVLNLWKDRVLIQFTARERAFYLYDEKGQTGYDRRHIPEEERARREGQSRASVGTNICIGLPVSWFSR